MKGRQPSTYEETVTHSRGMAARRLEMAILRILLWSLGLIVLAAVAYIGAVVITNSPTFAFRLLAYGESDIDDRRIFPERAIAKADTPSPLGEGPALVIKDVTYPYAGAARTETLADLLARTKTLAFIVIQNDRVLLESYAPGRTRESVVTSFSTAKSFDSALIGAAIADGLIGSADDPVIKYVPEVAGRGFDTLTVRDLLLMNTGIRYVHDDEQPFWKSAFGDDARTYYSDDLRWAALGVQASQTPVGKAFRYNNYHPLLEGLIIERVTGMHVAEYLEKRIWRPMGAAYDASWSLDSEASGFEKMESGINARPIDFASFGLLFLHGGAFNGQRILPVEWVKQSTMPPEPRPWEIWQEWPALGGYYSHHWWGLQLADGGYDFFARGKFQQTIYVAPRRNAVVVRFGDHPDEQVLWPLVIRGIVDTLPDG
jgi:CubicO group peptidase (beta-lactamase class C family)